MPPNVRFSTRTEGEFIPKLNCKSSAGTNFEKILLRFPAIVISDTDIKFLHFLSKTPTLPDYNLHWSS